MESKTKQELEAELARLNSAQTDIQKELVELKKAKAPKDKVDVVLERLKHGKEAISALQKEIRDRFPTQEAPKEKSPYDDMADEQLRKIWNEQSATHKLSLSDFCRLSKCSESKFTAWLLEKKEPSPGAVKAVRDFLKNPEHVLKKREIESKRRKKDWEEEEIEAYPLPHPLPGVGVEATTPILPVEGKRNILITSALPYVNNVPHLGNIIGCVLSADVFARYCRLRGYNTVYICGTDEYGTATETKALQEGTTPMEICNKYFQVHKKVYEWFGIQFDKFGRTTTEQQTEIAQDIFKHIRSNNYLVEQTLQQLYCPKCSRWLADRLVEGICPVCGYDGARGDQCDQCSSVYNAIELKEPRCQLDKGKPEIRDSSHLFLDLPQIQDKLAAWVDSSVEKGKWSANSVSITKDKWLKEGLKPRCITRDLKWGTPVPHEGYEKKVFYVWFDAPIGYISITANYTSEWRQWWKNPKNVKLYQFMGKDNIPFHCVIFPASLIATGEDWTLLDSISTTEFLNYEGTQFSKSRGVGVFGDHAVETGIPPEVWRFYLLSNRPETADSDFSWNDFAAKNNGELMANLGNFVNRCTKFVVDKFSGVVPPHRGAARLTEADKSLIASVNEHVTAYVKALEDMELREGLKTAMVISALGNQYLQEQEPWNLLKTDRQRCETVIGVGVNLAYLLAVLLEPFIPHFTEKLLHQLDLPHTSIKDSWEFEVPEGHKVRAAGPIFRKITPEELESFKKRFGSRGATPGPASNSTSTSASTSSSSSTSTSTTPGSQKVGEVSTL